MRPVRSAFFGFIVLLLSTSAVAPLQAQLVAQRVADSPLTSDPGRWSMDARVGIVWPIGVLSNIERTSGDAGVGVDYRVLPRLALRMDLGADFLLGRQSTYPGVLASKVPSMTLWNIRVGPVVWLTPSEGSRVMANVGLLGGATSMDTDASGLFDTGNGATDFIHLYPALDGVVWIGVRTGLHTVVFFSIRAHGVFTSRADTGVFSRFSTRMDSAGFSSAWVVPLQVGARVLF